jgi:hypothetical protein
MISINPLFDFFSFTDATNLFDLFMSGESRRHQHHGQPKGE